MILLPLIADINVIMNVALLLIMKYHAKHVLKMKMKMKKLYLEVI